MAAGYGGMKRVTSTYLRLVVLMVAGAVAQARHVRLDAAGAQHLARLVGGRRQQGRAFRDARRRGGGGDGAHARARRHQFGQHRAANGQRLPFPVKTPGQAWRL
jgi:hypothetical protein